MRGAVEHVTAVDADYKVVKSKLDSALERYSGKMWRLLLYTITWAQEDGKYYGEAAWSIVGPPAYN